MSWAVVLYTIAMSTSVLYRYYRLNSLNFGVLFMPFAFSKGHIQMDVILNTYVQEGILDMP